MAAGNGRFVQGRAQDEAAEAQLLDHIESLLKELQTCAELVQAAMVHTDTYCVFGMRATQFRLQGTSNSSSWKGLQRHQ